ncbi:hypothetical protein BJV74DRAFT_795561 [Russula compacta]|nr:hypothetical protein BJV74DRAFT_795561 [Russula compacta]
MDLLKATTFSLMVTFPTSSPRELQSTNEPMNYSLAPVSVNGRHCWLFDYTVRPGGSVVPQQLWIPQGQGDRPLYVEQAQWHMPVFFVNMDGSLGVPVVNAAAGQLSLRGANAPPPLGDNTTTKIWMHICTHSFHSYSRRSSEMQWPCYGPSEQQVQLRDQTPYRNPISLERLVKHLGNRVRQFLLRFLGLRAHVCPRSKLKLNCGIGRITFNEVVIIGALQVSARS